MSVECGQLEELFTNQHSKFMVLKRTIKARETWVKCYEELGSVSKAARKCGIPRSTLYRWIKRVELVGKDGLKSKN
jgi:transcriptional regulator of acetoin/glycerol metabolism